MRYQGLTWDHPRGFNALAEAERRGGPIHWEKQSLEGFESAPIADLCARYDLVVLDHPHLGEALAANCLQPMQNLLTENELQTIAEQAAGPAYRSYQMDGRTWALPLDAATQVMALRPDLIEGVPSTWDEMRKYALQGKMALSLAGPHAFLSLLSICAGIKPSSHFGADTWPAHETLQEAFELLAELADLAVKTTLDLNPIGILNLMSSSDEVALVPLIYGYVNYAYPARKNPISFQNAPRVGDNPPGSIIGGTGIALSARAQITSELREHILWLMHPQTQCGFIPDHDGQAGLAPAWHDERVNEKWGNFYAQTWQTLNASTIRPRHNGYIQFQSEASQCVRDALNDKVSSQKLAQTLTQMFFASQNNAE